MSMKVYPLVVDLSHWDPASDYSKVYQSGIRGVIYKATQGSNLTDPTYVAQQKLAKKAGLLWGSYHFGDDSDIQAQVRNYLKFAAPDPDELFCFDWEDNPKNGANHRTSLTNVKVWINAVETALNRPGECVIYSGNTAKELIQGSDPFFGARRLWLASYTHGVPTWQKSWTNYWLWQFTDGSTGPTPHAIPGIGNCDVNSFDRDGGEAELRATWASGKATTTPPVPTPIPPILPAQVPTVEITTKGDVVVIVNGQVVATVAVPATGQLTGNAAALTGGAHG